MIRLYIPGDYGSHPYQGLRSNPDSVTNQTATSEITGFPDLNLVLRDLGFSRSRVTPKVWKQQMTTFYTTAIAPIAPATSQVLTLRKSARKFSCRGCALRASITAA